MRVHGCAEGCVVVPIFARTDGDHRRPLAWPGMAGPSWPSVARGPMECDKDSLQEALALGLRSRRTEKAVALEDWLKSSFRPSSSIVDATLSLYGNHDVSAIQDHSAPQRRSPAANRQNEALGGNRWWWVFLGWEAFVGLDLVMRGPHAAEAVFVTGNAPLVDVLNKALGDPWWDSGLSQIRRRPRDHRRRLQGRQGAQLPRPARPLAAPGRSVLSCSTRRNEPTRKTSGAGEQPEDHEATSSYPRRKHHFRLAARLWWR